MKNRIPFMDSLKRNPSKFCAHGLVLGLALALSSCATGSSKRNPSPPINENPRSELVFLNIEEASGWVAYQCNPSGSTEMEDYRVVVIRQKTGQPVYDSVIPLASDLCTHGFEMAQDDPRLKRLATNVDAGIIEPLEDYQKSIKEEQESTPAPEPTPEPTPEAVPQAEPEVESSSTEAEGAPEADMKTDPISKVTISGMDGDAVLLELNGETAPKSGDRFFLHTPPEVIAIPGTGEKFVSSEGEVTGLVEVTSVKDGKVRAKLLSGNVPENGLAKKVEIP